MIEVREIKSNQPVEEWIIAIDKKTSISYYTRVEAIEIKKRLNELFPDRHRPENKMSEM